MPWAKVHDMLRKIPETLTFKRILLIMLGTAIATFGLHNIHQRVDITEGGVLGMLLLLDHWFDIPPSITTPVLDITCYLLAWRFLGSRFILLSIVSTTSMSLFFGLWDLFPPMLPDLSGMPLLAALLGGVFVGIGVGLVVRQGGSSGGDDALALVISHVTHWRLARAYLFTDLTVLGLSLTYIPVQRIAFSLVTVFVSSFLIDIVKDGVPDAMRSLLPGHRNGNDDNGNNGSDDTHQA